MVTCASDRQTPELAQFTSLLEEGGITLIRRTAAPDRLDSLIRAMRNKVGCVVLNSGDQMLRAAAIALRDTGLPLGILPCRPIGDLARRLAIPSDPAAAAALICRGHKQPLDLGIVNGQPFFNVASVGLTVLDARRLGRAAHRPYGRLAFAWQAARLAFRTARFAAIIRCGSVVHRVYTVQITIGNGHAYTGRMEAGTEQPGTNGILDVYSLEPASKWQFLFLGHAFSARNHTVVPEARRMQCSLVEIVTRLPRPITADGAAIALTPARFTILPGAIKVFAPAPDLPGQAA